MLGEIVEAMNIIKGQHEQNSRQTSSIHELLQPFINDYNEVMRESVLQYMIKSQEIMCAMSLKSQEILQYAQEARDGARSSMLAHGWQQGTSEEYHLAQLRTVTPPLGTPGTGSVDGEASL